MSATYLPKIGKNHFAQWVCEGSGVFATGISRADAFSKWKQVLKERRSQQKN